MEDNQMDYSARIDTLYRSFGIRHPHEIDLDAIAERLGIQVRYLPHDSVLVRPFGYPVLSVNRDEEPIAQREQLAHEIAHELLHCGSQLASPDSYISLQEEQARLCALYLLAPAF